MGAQIWISHSRRIQRYCRGTLILNKSSSSAHESNFTQNTSCKRLYASSFTLQLMQQLHARCFMQATSCKILHASNFMQDTSCKQFQFIQTTSVTIFHASNFMYSLMRCNHRCDRLQSCDAMPDAIRHIHRYDHPIIDVIRRSHLRYCAIISMRCTCRCNTMQSWTQCNHRCHTARATSYKILHTSNTIINTIIQSSTGCGCSHRCVTTQSLIRCNHLCHTMQIRSSMRSW
jgi:hypothetical protein